MPSPRVEGVGLVRGEGGVSAQTVSSPPLVGLWARILQVALGKHSLQRREATQQVLRVVRQVPHPQYNARTHDNDLMLLRLERPARLGSAVRPIAVARTCPSLQTSCRVSGWGTTSSPIGEDPRPLERSKLGVGGCGGKGRGWAPGPREEAVGPHIPGSWRRVDPKA